MPRKGKERPFLCNSARASERRRCSQNADQSCSWLECDYSWQQMTRSPGHSCHSDIQLPEHAGTLNDSTIGVRQSCAMCDRPYFYLQKYSSSFSCKHSATKVQSYRTFHNGPAMLQQSTGEQIEQSEFNLLPRTSLNFFTYYKYLKRKFMVNCFSLFLAHAICWLETFESLQN